VSFRITSSYSEPQSGWKGWVMRNRPEVTPTQPAFDDSRQCVRGTVGAVCQGGVSLQAHSVWGVLTPPCLSRVPRALSFRTQPPGKGKFTTLPRPDNKNLSPQCPLPTTPRRLASILLPGCLNILAIRGSTSTCARVMLAVTRQAKMEPSRYLRQSAWKAAHTKHT